MVSTTGKVALKDIKARLEFKLKYLSLNNKLLDNLVQIGSNVEPIAMGSITTTVNAGLEKFVKAASLEYSKFRINVVSPTVIEEALDKYAPAAFYWV